MQTSPWGGGIFCHAQTVSSGKQHCSGKIVDETDNPVIGASVFIKGTKTGTVTDMEGNFVLSNVTEGQTIEISCIGYESREVVFTGETISIKLKEDSKLLDEVVVVGYGVQKKVNLTGAVSAVSSNDLKQRANNNLLKSLQGSIPGVMIISRPGSSPTINFRGRGNLGTSAPLYVIDGVISSSEEFENMDQNTIESISFLKDAASSSIYGARAAYGVVLVKTKEGKSDKIRIDYTGSMGIKNPTYISQTLSSAEYAILFNEAILNSNPNAKVRYSDEEIELFRSGKDPDRYPNTQFFSELIRKNAIISQHSIGISGKGKVNFYTGLGYMKDHDFTPGQSSDKFNFTSNLSTEIKPWLTFRGNVKAYLLNNNNSLGRFSMMEFLRVAPTFVGRHSDGSFGTIDGGIQASKENLARNPYRTVYDGSWKNSQRKSVTIDAGTDIKPFKDFTISSNFTYSTNIYNSKDYSPSRQELVNFITKQPVSGSGREESKMSVFMQETSRMTTNLTANYGKEISGHSFNILVGTSYEDHITNSSFGYRKNFPNNSLTDIAAGSSAPENMYFGGNAKDGDPGVNRFKIFSLFGRVNYSYKGKYLAEFNLRQDASSRFHENHRRAIFPSLSLGWRLSEENFMKSLKFVNNFKIRASYGTLGNINNVGNYDYIATYTPGDNYVFDGKVAESIKENKPANEKLSWEKVAISDIGADMDLFDNRLIVVADFYHKLTSDILLTPNIPNEIGLGKKSKPSSNIGKVLNKGLEIGITWRDEIRGFNYQVGANMSYNNNKIIDLGSSDPIIEDYRIKKVGYPVGTFYGFKTDGLLTENDIKTGNYISDGTAVQPGDIKYEDVKKDKVLDGNDRTFIGCEIPKLTYGLHFQLGYKGFDLSVMGQGVYGTKVRFGEEQAHAFFDDASPRKYHLGRWTKDNPNPKAVYPRIYSRTDSHSSFNQKNSDFWLFNSDYFRIKNITLGYTIPSKISGKIGASYLKIYFSAENYFTIRGDKRMKDFDPESASGRGVAALGEKTLSFGLNIGF